MNFAFTNINIYRAIAEDAYAEMCSLDSGSRIPKNDGSGGYILKYDPDHRSFKHAMVVIVFTGMWLEALLHQLIVQIHGEAKFKEVDRTYTYERKLELIGVTDIDLIGKVKRFRESRKELVHEKAYFDGSNIKSAQEEAALASDVMSVVSTLIQRDMVR